MVLSDIAWNICAVCQRFHFQRHNISNHDIILSSSSRTGDLPEDWITKKCLWIRQKPVFTSKKPMLLSRYDPDLLYTAKLVSINLYFVFQKVCNRKPILTINASHLRSTACFSAQKKKKSLCSPLANWVTFSAIINALQGFFSYQFEIIHLGNPSTTAVNALFLCVALCNY